MCSLFIRSVTRRKLPGMCSIWTTSRLKSSWPYLRPCHSLNGVDTRSIYLSQLFNSPKMFYSTQSNGNQYSTSTRLLQDTISETKEIFSQPLGALNSLNLRLISKLGIPTIYKENLRRSSKGHVCELELTWPEALKFSATAKRKTMARAQASLQALHWLHSQNYITESAHPILRDLANSENKLSENFNDSTIASLNESDIFSRPLLALSNLNQKVTSNLGLSYIFREKIGNVKNDQVCTLEFTWPEPIKFSATAKRKRMARTQASLQALHWLRSHNFIDESAQPILRDLADSKNKLSIKFNDSTVTNIDEVLKVYSEKVAPALNSAVFSKVDANKKEISHPTLGIPFPTEEELIAWNDVLNKKNPNTTQKMGPILPIVNYRKEILDSIANNRVTIVKGETGCGKTTKVPQFILEEAIDSGLGAYCNIAVIQPRRLTTIETAKYVAKERGENIGQCVGYNVKMATKLSSVIGGSITFLTGMKFAQKFTDNSSLKGISHVVIDEVHIRDIGTDLVMTLLKQAMNLNRDLRVILMSATVDTSSFQSYFECFGNVKICTVPGRTFPVKMHFLDDLPTQLQVNKRRDRENLNLEVDFEQVRKVVSWINRTKPGGGVLVFLSGWNEISQLQKILSNEANLLIVPVHSMFRNCSAAFKPAPNGLRKVILATNIAETSLTFPDIVYVIDCGTHKTQKRNVLSPGGWSTNSMNTEWITKANVIQRKGRAGRVQPGESFHLFTKETFSEMENYELPSILTQSLEYLILSIKMVNPDIKASMLLKQFLTPPSERDVQQAVHTLQSVSLLSSSDEKPTALAVAVMQMSSSLPSALALIYSSIFRCFHKTLSIIAAQETPLVLNSESTDIESRATFERSFKENYHQSSDHLAKGYAVSDMGNMSSSFKQTRVLKAFLERQIKSMTGAFNDGSLNENCNEELVLSIILNCYGSLLVNAHNNSMKVFVQDKSGMPAVVKSTSINSKNRKTLKSPFLVYIAGSLVREKLLTTSDTSIVSPLSVLLFLPNLSKFRVSSLKGTESEELVIRAWYTKSVCLHLQEENYHRIIGLRKALADCLHYFVIAEALNQPDNNYELLCVFRSQLIQCVSLMLSGQQNQENISSATDDRM